MELTLHLGIAPDFLCTSQLTNEICKMLRSVQLTAAALVSAEKLASQQCIYRFHSLVNSKIKVKQN